MTPILDVAGTAAPYDIVRAALAALGVIAVAWMLDDNIRNWRAARHEVWHGRLQPWAPDYWIAFANLIGCILNCVAWVLLAAGAAIVVVTPPPPPDRELAEVTSNVLLILGELVLAAVQIWQLIARRKRHQLRRRVARKE